VRIFSGFSVSVREGTFHGGFNLRQVCGVALLRTHLLDVTQSIRAGTQNPSIPNRNLAGHGVLIRRFLITLLLQKGKQVKQNAPANKVNLLN
jgi:hypothetical protein